MQAQLTITVSERAVAFRDLPLESFFISHNSQGAAKIRRKVSKDACCSIGRKPVRMLMCPSTLILPISMPEVVAIAPAEMTSGLTGTKFLHSRQTRSRAEDASRNPYQQWQA